MANPVVETESATVLALASSLVSQFSLNIINTVIGTTPEVDGDYLTTDVVEEMTLSEIQKRLVAKGDKDA